MANPVLVEVTRGDRVESRHRGAFAVVDADGRSVAALGDVEVPVFPRSAVKALQALPLVESGAADAFGFGPRELALAQASHGGEPPHVEGVTAMLAAIGLDETALECGAHVPTHSPSAAELIRRGEKPEPAAQQLLRQARQFPRGRRHLGIDHRGYVGADHPRAGAGARGAARTDRRGARRRPHAAPTAARSPPMRCRLPALGAGLCAAWRPGRAFAAAGGGGEAALRRRRPGALLRRRERAFLHRCDARS